jgi:hypothetical protein
MDSRLTNTPSVRAWMRGPFLLLLLGSAPPLTGCFLGKEPVADSGPGSPSDGGRDLSGISLPCGAQRSCTGGSCNEIFPGLETACDDDAPCTHDDRCNGKGDCVGTPIACTSDACATRACNGTATCSVTAQGTPVYESFQHGFHYSTSGSGTIVFRIPANLTSRKRIYLRYAPGIADKMLTTIPNESSTCDWCACTSQCQFTQNVESFDVSAVREAGMVQLNRFTGHPTEGIGDPPEHPGSFRHRGSALTILPGWTFDVPLDASFVCLP